MLVNKMKIKVGMKTKDKTKTGMTIQIKTEYKMKHDGIAGKGGQQK